MTPSATPGKDIATLIKTTFNPTEIGVGPVTFRPNRSGLTVTSKLKDDLDKLENALKSTQVTRSALEIRRPSKRFPQLRISGVDPDIVPAMVLDQINSRNNLNISPEDFKPRTHFTEHLGNKVHIIEVAPNVYNILKQRATLHIGWTSCHVRENFYVPMCY